ncbi:MAG: hypothetical protein ACM65K_06525 [Microcoleus sp.]
MTYSTRATRAIGINGGMISNPVTSELFISLISLCVLCVLVRLNHSDAAGNDMIPGFEIARGRSHPQALAF